jgi:dUTP pyrophosphatase
MTTVARNALSVLLDEINGSCGPHVIAAINGNLPDGWSARGLRAFPVVISDSVQSMSVCVNAECHDVPAYQYSVGAKVVILADEVPTHLQIADRLADQLSGRIRHAPPPSGRDYVIRISLDPGAIMPTRGTDGSSGYDLYAPEDVLFRPGQILVIHSGVHLELQSSSWEAQVRPRSSMSRRGLWVSLGTVDSDYRGVVGATMANLTREDQRIQKGERYAQLVIARVAHPAMVEVDAAALTQTGRGAGWFGSTGR